MMNSIERNVMLPIILARAIYLSELASLLHWSLPDNTALESVFMCYLQLSSVLCLLVVLTDVASAWYGTVTFHSKAYFKGSSYPWGISETQRCYNLACWDNKASSVKWEGLPKTGSFNGKARIAFFTGKDCTGDSRDWPTDGVINGKKGNYPQDFTLDGINDAVTSFIVWETTKKTTNGKALPCPWGTS
ncbi:unnamed protein product [Phytophthora lilii]|uniref:Unnamed protein product n=1 Tax=Phytophthora lilii TaxID=2077276 RepID=A0A9W7CJR3_9STRA|nr:unnamed protein product [Phytophthora lilii]